VKIEKRPWRPQDLIDDLQSIIDEEMDNYLNTKRTTLCQARDYLKEYFSLSPNDSLSLEGLRELLDAQREVAEEIAEDFIEFVTGSVQNAAEYCANMRPECCESPGWCTGKSKECKGFFPKAAKGPEEEKR